MAAAFNLTAQINLQGPANLKATVSKIKKELGSIKTTLNLDVKAGTAKNLGQITRSLNNLSKAATNANASISTLNGTLSTLASSFNNASSSTSAALNGFNSVSKSAKGSTKAITETRTAIEEFGKQSGLAIKRFAAFSTVSTVIYGVVNALTSGYKEFLTFNQEIVRLSQVTNKSVSDLKGVTDEITRLSTGLGVASSDLLTVTTTLAQAGFTAEETKIALEALAKSALAPSFENLASTTEGAIAAMRQFGIQASELDNALGSINAVAAAFAVEAGDIIAAIQRTGGVFASASKGVSEGTDSLNEFIAVFTSVRATTRESAETIATGLRTIFTRIQRSSTIQLLKDYGVELRDLEGKFVGPYEAVKRLSEGLNKIDPRSAAFAAISEELGGFRQIGKVIPLLQQFGVAQDALNVAQRGQKSLAKDAIAAQQSLAVQFTKTRESFLALIRDIGETGTFKAFVGTTITLTNALITLGGALKPILPLLLTFTAIKLGSSLKQYTSGFLGAFGKGGDGATGGGGVPGGGGGGGGGGGSASKAAALLNNTTALNALNTSILALNQNIVNTNSLLMNRPAGGKFASGGLVPGSGNSDTYRAMLTPGEFVIRKKAVEKIGAENLARMNNGGIIRKYAGGSPGTTGVEEISDSDILQKFFKDQFDPKQNIIRGKIIAGKPVIITAASIRNRKPETLAKSSGLPLKSLEEAKIALLQKSQISAKEAQRLRVAEKLEKRSAIKENRVLDFGLVGLRYGSSAKDIDTMTTFDAGKPNGFEEKKYNINKAIDSSNAFIRIKAATVSEKLKSTEAEKIQNLILDSFKKSIVKTSTHMASLTKGVLTVDKSKINDSVKNSDFYNVIGAALESSLGLLGAPLVQKTEKTKSIDFPEGLGGSAQIFGSAFENIPTDVTRTIGGEGKGIPRYKEQIIRWLATDAGQKYLSKFPNVKFAQGGSTEDSVHALLTPGEFVFNKEAAQRIGYNNLNRLNKADKLPGFNKGGAVGTFSNPRRYVEAGVVRNNAGQIIPQRTTNNPPTPKPQGTELSLDKAAVVAAVTSILLPEVQKLASSFGKLEGSAAEAGAAMGGFVREASSMVLSAGIAMQTIGASQGQTAAAQIFGGTLGGIGGALTDYGAKAMERALTKNTESLGKFSKDLEDYRNAPTEELKMQASKQLEKSFFELDKVVRKSIPELDNLERFQLAGDALSSFTQTTLTAATAIIALQQAASAYAAAQALTGGSAKTGITGAILGGMAKNPQAAAVMIGVAAIVAAGVAIFGSYNKSLKKSQEQLEKLASALEDTVKSSKDFSLLNTRYTQQVLPQFNTTISRKELGTLDIGNELNLLFREQFKSVLQSQNIILDQSEKMADLQKALTKQGDPEVIKKFEEARTITKEILTKDLFRKAKKEQGLEEATINDLISRIGLDEMERVAIEYAGKFNQTKLATDQLALAMSKLRITVLSLNNVLSLAESGFQQIVANTTNTFNDLDKRINTLLSKEPTVTTGESLRRDVQVLENLPMARPEQLDAIFERAQGTLGINPNDSEQVKLFNQLKYQTKGLSIIERDMAFALTAISKQNANEDKTLMILEDVLDSSIREVVGIDGQDIANQLISETANAINNVRAEKGGSVALEDLGPAVQDYINKTKTGLESFRKSLEAVANGFNLLGEQEKKLFDLNQEAMNLQIQRRYNEIQNNIEQRRALGQFIALVEMNSGAMSEVLKLTQSIQTPVGMLTGQKGTTNPDIIIDELKRTIAEQQRISDIPFTDRTKTEREMLVPLADKAANLKKALEKLADSSSFLKNMFDKLAQSESFDKNKRNMLFDLITNPEPANMLQFQRKAIGLDVLLRGAEGAPGTQIDIGAGPMAAEGLQLAGQLFPQEIVDKLQRQFMANFIKDNPQIATPAIRKQILESIEKGSPLTQALNARIDAEKAAISRINQFLDQQYINAINDRTKTLANSFEFLSTTIRSLFGEITTYGKKTEEKIGAYNPPKPTPPVTVPAKKVESLRQTLMGLTKSGMFGSESLEPEQVQELIGKYLPYSTAGVTLEQFDAAIREAVNKAASNVKRDFGKDYWGRFWETWMTNQVSNLALENTQDALLPFVNDRTMGPLIRQQEAQTAADIEAKRQYDLDFRTKRGAPITPMFPPPQTLPSNNPLVPNITRPPTKPQFNLDTSSINNFDQTINKMVKAFSPDGGVTKLATAVESFGTVADSLMVAVNELKKTIPNGIVKVEQNIKSEVDVSIPGGVDINASRTQLAQSDVDKLGASIVGAVKNGVGAMFGFPAKG